VYSDDSVEKAPKPSMMERSKERHGNAYQPWDEEGDALLLKMYAENPDINFIAEVFERSSGSIRHRLKRLGVLED
jgi:adenine specific DNA methylase Mod